MDTRKTYHNLAFLQNHEWVHRILSFLSVCLLVCRRIFCHEDPQH